MSVVWRIAIFCYDSKTPVNQIVKMLKTLGEREQFNEECRFMVTWYNTDTFELKSLETKSYNKLCEQN